MSYAKKINTNIKGTPRPKKWNIKVSEFALKTHNPIRAIVEGMKIEPNPDKQMIALSIGDPTTFGNLKPAKEVMEAIRDTATSGQHNGYGPSIGFVEARQAIAEYSSHQREDISPNDVIICSGCSCSLDICISVLAGPGQNILIPRPGFSIYKTLCEGFGVETRSYNLLPEKNWEVDLKRFESLIDAKTAAIVLNNPSNPCGSVFSKSHLQELVRIAEKHFVPIIADEIYEHFVFPGKEYHAVSSVAKTVPVLTCSGLTKRFLVPGWRLGWIIIHDPSDVFGEVRKGIGNLSARILGANTMVQGAIPAILKNTPQSFYDNLVNTLHRHAKIAYDKLSAIKGLKPVLPDGAMYLMIGISLIHFPEFATELHFVQCLVQEQSVFCLPGTCFDCPNFMRIVLTVPEEMMIKACDRIAEFCEAHYKIDNRIIEEKMLANMELNGN